MATDEEIADKAASDIMDGIEEHKVILKTHLSKHVLGAIKLAKREAYMGLMAELPAKNHHMQLED